MEGGICLSLTRMNRILEIDKENEFARLQQQQGREHAGEATITILKRMDFQKHYHPQRDDQQRMQMSGSAFLLHPGDQFSHQAWRIEGARRLKHHTDLRAAGENLDREKMLELLIASDNEIRLTTLVNLALSLNATTPICTPLLTPLATLAADCPPTLATTVAPCGTCFATLSR